LECVKCKLTGNRRRWLTIYLPRHTCLEQSLFKTQNVVHGYVYIIRGIRTTLSVGLCSVHDDPREKLGSVSYTAV